MADLTSHTVTVDTTSLVRGRDHYKYFRRPLGSEGNTLSDMYPPLLLYSIYIFQLQYYSITSKTSFIYNIPLYISTNNIM